MPIALSKRALARPLLALVCIGVSIGALQARAQDRFVVRWANDHLSIHAANVPLSDVVAEVARVTGLRVVGADKLQGPVSVDFTDFAAVDALKALLADVNYFIQQEPLSDEKRLGLVLHVHSMARTSAAPPVSADPVLHVPALDALLEDEAEEIQEAKEEEAEDPDIEQENKENRHAAQQLVENGAIGSKATMVALERYLHSDNDQIRLEAVKAIAARPLSDSLKLLLMALGDDSIEVRRTAINALGRDRSPESLLGVGVALEKDQDPLVRQGALRIFALRADPAATPHLQNALADNDEIVREAAKQMLAEFARLARLKKQ
jgi:HEAT repeat protein